MLLGHTKLIISCTFTTNKQLCNCGSVAISMRRSKVKAPPNHMIKFFVFVFVHFFLLYCPTWLSFVQAYYQILKLLCFLLIQTKIESIQKKYILPLYLFFYILCVYVWNIFIFFKLYIRIKRC